MNIKFNKEFLKSFYKWLEKNNELFLGPLGLIVIYYCEDIVTKFFPADPMISAAFLYKLVYSVGALFLIHFTAYVFIICNWRGINNYYDTEYDNDFKSLTPWERIKYSTSVFFAYILALVVLMATI